MLDSKPLISTSALNKLYFVSFLHNSIAKKTCIYYVFVKINTYFIMHSLAIKYVFFNS